ncbi:MAG: 23S rRNA (uracil(1939)-C(5))-methyltransferase RlmD [Clostridia bacterium]|nr:23S rRNA (uracil(1939)-C(5))-methyltransferase RlmD [Clostridia bacterium]
MINVGDILELTIENSGMNGEGVARHDGQVVFIPLTLKGEIVKAQVTKVDKKYVSAKVIKIITPSPKRVTPACPIFFKCGGCDMQHIVYSEQLSIKRASVQSCLDKARINAIAAPTVPSPKIYAYRNKAQVPIARKDGCTRAGYYRTGTHDLVPFPANGCALHDDTTNSIISALTDEFNNCNLPPYDESNGKGIIRHIVVRRADNCYAVTIVVNSDTLPHADKIKDRLLKIGVPISLTVNVNKANTNVIFGKKTACLYGDMDIECNICGVRARISPQSFMQINDDICSAIYRHVAQFVSACAPRTVIDAYGGIGVISNLVAPYCDSVKCIEIVPSAIADGRRMAQDNGNSDIIDNVLGDCAKVIAQTDIDQDTLVILDPPRKGCDKAVLDALNSSECRHIVYISCNPATLARDLALLSNNYEVMSVTPYDMFPMTKHVETLVCLKRK